MPNAVYIFEIVACNRVGAGAAGDRLATRTLQPGEAGSSRDKHSTALKALSASVSIFISMSSCRGVGGIDSHDYSACMYV